MHTTLLGQQEICRHLERGTKLDQYTGLDKKKD